MSRLANALVFILLTVTISCSRSGSRYGEIQYASELIVERLDNNRFPLEPIASQSGVRYEFLAQGCLCSSSPLFVCSSAEGWTVTVNGTPVPIVEGLHQIDDNDGCYVIAGLVKDGWNVIELTGDGVPSPSFIVGDFDVNRQEESGSWILKYATVAGIGPLSDQGLPFYAGEISYRRKVVVPERVGRRVLEVEDWRGASCEILVNGSSIASVFSGKFKKNIGRELNPGINEIEVRLCGPSEEFGLLREFTLK